MKYTLILTLVILISSQKVVGQVNIDTNIQLEYDSMMKSKEPTDERERIIDSIFGLAYIVEMKDDTLNKKDFKPQQISVISQELEDPETGQTIPVIYKGMNEKAIFNNTTLQKDTLKIRLSYGLLNIKGLSRNSLVELASWGFKNGQGFSIDLFNKNKKCEYAEYSFDTRFRNKLTDKKSNIINVSLKENEIVLSKYPTTYGDVIYGKAVLKTNPFYMDNISFKTGYICKRVKCILLFKSIVAHQNDRLAFFKSSTMYSPMLIFLNNASF